MELINFFLSTDISIGMVLFEKASDFIKNKLDAVMCYKSQFYDPNDSSEETPISTKNFLDSIEYRARDLGRLTGVEYAEGFNTLRIPIIDNISDLK